MGEGVGPGALDGSCRRREEKKGCCASSIAVIKEATR